MPSEIMPKTILGIHTEICGGVDPASAKVRKSVKNNIKINDREKPSAICRPVPPRLFLEETMQPMNTSIKIVNGEE
jgi:hypothetical protein